MSLNQQKTDCQQKANNLKTALNSIIYDDFENEFLLENFIQCQKESLAATEKLLESLMVAYEKEGA